MTDEETGVDAVAKDGEPNADEIARRRAAKSGGSAKDRAAAEEQAKLDSEDTSEKRDGDGEEDDGQLFVWEQGRKVTLGTLIARGTPVEHAWVFGGSRKKGRGGLPAMDEDVILVLRGRTAKYSIVPTRDDEERVTKVTVEVHLAAKVVEPADSDEAEGLLAGVLDARGFEKRKVA